MIALAGSQLLFGCAASTPPPVVHAPTTVVQAPDPAVVHRIWQEGYAAGYGAAENLAMRRNEQQQDQLSNVPEVLDVPAPAPAASPVADAPSFGGFQSIGPATPVKAGN